MPIIREKVQPDNIVYSDCWRGYNVLDVSEFKRYRINHSKLFANERKDIIKSGMTTLEHSKNVPVLFFKQENHFGMGFDITVPEDSFLDF